MLTGLDIENFKCFGKRVHIPLAPITLIYGENSAGKSSILKALYFLRSCVNCGRSEFLAWTDLSQPAGFEALIHNHDRSRVLSLGVGFDIEEPQAHAPSAKQFMSTCSLRCEGNDVRLTLHDSEDATSCEVVLRDHTEDQLLSDAHALLISNRDIMHLQIKLRILLDALTIADPSGNEYFGLFLKHLPQEFRKTPRARVVGLPSQPEAPVAQSDLAITDLWIGFGHGGHFPEHKDLGPLGDLRGLALRRITSKSRCAKLGLPVNSRQWCLRQPADASSIGLQRKADEGKMSAYASAHQAALAELVARTDPIMRNARESATVKWSSALRFYQSPFSKEALRARLQLAAASMAEDTSPPATWINAVDRELAVLLSEPLLRPPCSHAFDWDTESSITSGWHLRASTSWWKEWESLRIRRGSFPHAPGKADAMAGTIPARFHQRLHTMAVHIGPQRARPQRSYSDDAHDGVEFTGKGWTALLTGPDSKGVQEACNEWLDQFCGYSVTVRDTLSSPMHEVAITDTRRRLEIGLPDVGYGFSQVMPILACSMGMKHRSFTIEQPEVHIHPRLQAELASLMAHSMRERGNQFIVETHSEYLVLRLQRLIRRKLLAPSQIAVLYVERDDAGSNVRQLRLDDRGSFMDPWPRGFFPEREREMEW